MRGFPPLLQAASKRSQTESICFASEDGRQSLLDPGGSLEGWLYFQHVARREGALSFDASLMSVDGAALGSLSIPYTFAR